MKIKKIEVFTYAELTDSAKERARAKFLQADEYPWWKDSEDSLRSFCNHFGVGGLDFSIGAFCHSYATAKPDNSHFKGLKLKNFTDSDKLAKNGYCVEIGMFDNFYSEWKKTGSPLLGFMFALAEGCKEIQRDMEYHQSDEYVQEMMDANDWEFTEDGDWFGYREAA